MAPDAAGWDWAGINLADGGALMAFRMRDRAGGALWAGGTLRGADGRVRTFAPDEVRFDADAVVALAAHGRRLSGGDDGRAPATSRSTLEPLIDDQELDSRASTGTIYWEGAVRAPCAGREAGRGYLELTGLRHAAAALTSRIHAILTIRPSRQDVVAASASSSAFKPSSMVVRSFSLPASTAKKCAISFAYAAR